MDTIRGEPTVSDVIDDWGCGNAFLTDWNKVYDLALDDILECAHEK